MSCLNKDSATFDAKRFVCTHVRTTQPSSLGIASMLILKHVINDKYFFAPKMPVWVEVSTRRPSNQGRAELSALMQNLSDNRGKLECAREKLHPTKTYFNMRQ